MADLPTRADYFAIGEDEVLTRSLSRPIGDRLSAEEVRTEGSSINLLIAAASAMADEVTRQCALRIKALFLDGADGDDLDRLVADRFSPTVVRKTATPAIAIVEVSRSSGTLPIVILATGSKFKTDSGVEFESTQTLTFTLGETGTKTAIVQALDAGSIGNVAAGTITQFSTPPNDPALTVTNTEPAAGGDDTESDSSLRERARNFFLVARRGTLEAIEFGALTVAGIRLATAVELVDAMGVPTGTVQLFISDIQGQGNKALRQKVIDALCEYRPVGVYVDVISTSPFFVDIEYNLRFEAGVDSTLAFEQVRNATLARVNVIPPNETLSVSLLFEAARSVPGVIVLGDAIVTPVGDVVPAIGQTLRTSADRITAV